MGWPWPLVTVCTHPPPTKQQIYAFTLHIKISYGQTEEQFLMFGAEIRELQMILAGTVLVSTYEMHDSIAKSIVFLLFLLTLSCILARAGGPVAQ